MFNMQKTQEAGSREAGSILKLKKRYLQVELYFLQEK